MTPQEFARELERLKSEIPVKAEGAGVAELQRVGQDIGAAELVVGSNASVISTPGGFTARGITGRLDKDAIRERVVRAMGGSL